MKVNKSLTFIVNLHDWIQLHCKYTSKSALEWCVIFWPELIKISDNLNLHTAGEDLKNPKHKGFFPGEKQKRKIKGLWSNVLRNWIQTSFFKGIVRLCFVKKFYNRSLISFIHQWDTLKWCESYHNTNVQQVSHLSAVDLANSLGKYQIISYSMYFYLSAGAFHDNVTSF